MVRRRLAARTESLAAVRAGPPPAGLIDGRPVELPLFNANWGGTSADNHLANIQALAFHDLPVDFYWIDAEWFGEGPWFVNPGNWEAPSRGFTPTASSR